MSTTSIITNNSKDLSRISKRNFLPSQGNMNFKPMLSKKKLKKENTKLSNWKNISKFVNFIKKNTMKHKN